MKDKMRFGSIWMHCNTGIIVTFGFCRYTTILVFGDHVEIKFTTKVDAQKVFLKEFYYIGEE
jgi:hypothetical protein